MSKEIYSIAAAPQFFYYCLLTADYMLGSLYVRTQLAPTMPCCHPIVEMSGQSQRCS